MRMKRWIALLLSLVLLLGVVPALTMAVEVGPDQLPGKTAESERIYETRVNPLFADRLSEKDLVSTDVIAATKAESPTVFHDSVEGAAAEIREQLKLRQDVVTVGYLTENLVGGEMRRLFDAAMEHTGDPTEGDYLKWQWGGYNGYYQYNYTDRGLEVLFVYYLSYYTSLEQENIMNYEVEMLLEELDLYDADDYHKAKGVYDWICDNVTYDYEHLETDSYYDLMYTAYGALVDRTSVCQGYAVLLYRLMLELDVDCRVVTGPNHAWNIIRLDDLYYSADSTWDAGLYYYDYFLKGESFHYDHPRDPDYNTESFLSAYPHAVEDYVYTPSAIQITKYPRDVKAGDGQEVVISVEAQGKNLTYQWYFKNAGASKFSLTKTFTGNTYTTIMNKDRDGRQVYCVITDADGNKIQTKPVTMTMVNGVTIVKQPQDVTAAAGETFYITVEAEGVDLTYQWYYKDAGSSKFLLTKSFTGDTYTTVMTEGRDGRQVYCVVTDKYGNSVKTNVVIMIMEPSDMVLLSQPESVIVANGVTATVTVEAIGDGLTYAWYYKNAGDTKFTLTTTFTGNTYTADMNADRDGRQVYCVITDAYGNSIRTETVVISMAGVELKPLRITSQPDDVYAAKGKKFTITVKASGEGLTYKWYYKDAGAIKFLLTTSFTGNTYTATMSAARDGRQIYCVITDKYGNSVKTETVTLNMD